MPITMRKTRISRDVGGARLGSSDPGPRRLMVSLSFFAETCITELLKLAGSFHSFLRF